MKLLILDTEISDDNSICEIAGTLYEVGDVCGAIASVSTLLPVRFNEYQHINLIPAILTQESVMVYIPGVNYFQTLINQADYIVAFNADFDRDIVSKVYQDLAQSKPWICAMKDMDWGYPSPNSHGGFKLTDLALWLGIGISTIHRAGDDVRLLVECFNRHPNTCSIIDLAIETIKSPITEIKALVDYDNRTKARDAKFAWDGTRRIWTKTMRECKLDAFVKTLDFEVEVIG